MELDINIAEIDFDENEFDLLREAYTSSPEPELLDYCLEIATAVKLLGGPLNGKWIAMIGTETRTFAMGDGFYGSYVRNSKTDEEARWNAKDRSREDSA